MEEIVKSIGRMLNRKMDAVRCIVNKSEQFALDFHENQLGNANFTYFDYYSSKLSNVSIRPKFLILNMLIIILIFSRRLTDLISPI